MQSPQWKYGRAGLDAKSLAKLERFGWEFPDPEFHLPAILAAAAVEPLDGEKSFDPAVLSHKVEQILDMKNALEEIPTLTCVLVAYLRGFRSDLRDLMLRNEIRRYYGENDVGCFGPNRRKSAVV